MAEFYLQHEYWFAANPLIPAMLGMGANLTGRDFRDVVREPRAVSAGTAIQLVAYLAPRAARLSRVDTMAIEFEVVVRNINLGILLKASIFPAAAAATAQIGDTVFFTLLLYGTLQLVIGGVLLGLYRRTKGL